MQKPRDSHHFLYHELGLNFSFIYCTACSAKFYAINSSSYISRIPLCRRPLSLGFKVIYFVANLYKEYQISLSQDTSLTLIILYFLPAGFCVPQPNSQSLTGRKNSAIGLSYWPAYIGWRASTATLCLNQLYPPVRDYEFGY